MSSDDDIPTSQVLPLDLTVPLDGTRPALVVARASQVTTVRTLRSLHGYVLRFLPTSLTEDPPMAVVRYQNAIRNALTAAAEGYLALYAQRWTPTPDIPASLGEQLLRVSGDTLEQWFATGAQHGLPPAPSWMPMTTPRLHGDDAH